METKYRWLPINQIDLVKQAKATKLQVRCHACDNVMIDRLGRMRTDQTIWQFGSGGGAFVYGHAHQGCAYMVEVEGIEANTKDPNFGKAPNEWN